ncbi:hypothetical protein [Rhizobium sp. BE258]|uniref:hypothetical protein n=1 Tax=Rhizobium sp. BE258 TaxID=2817722 RepID=UPI00285C4DA3|nr:hypothetical protein [Rhizobium sp. BE258]MDR7141942.1 hypothetical protein [Rhizobium sp. BE258]
MNIVITKAEYEFLESKLLAAYAPKSLAANGGDDPKSEDEVNLAVRCLRRVRDLDAAPSVSG